MSSEGKVIIVSAPSGSGKSTLINEALQKFPQLEFSVSACSRPKREHEIDGQHYYFLTVEQFKEQIQQNLFVEWEEVYPNNFYGTKQSEIDRIWQKGNVAMFDVDVKGGLNLKKYFGNKALSIFIQPPSIEVLKERLQNRGTETPETLNKRLSKAEYELSFANQFDKIILNDDLKTAQQEIVSIIAHFLER